MKILRNFYNFFITYIIRPFIYQFFILRWELFRKSPFYFRYYGYKIFYQPKDGLVYHVGSTGNFEKDVINCCLKFLPSDATVVDVGANIGLITLPLASLLPRAYFHCFEPSPYPYRYFRKTLIENMLTGRIKLNNIGLYNYEGRLKFYTHDIKDASGDGLKDTHRAGKVKPIIIKVTTIDKYVKTYNIKKVHLLKIDIEGAELFVLKGAIKTIRRFSPEIILEVCPKNLDAYNIDVRDIYRFFQKIGYKIYNIRGRLLDEKRLIDLTEREGNYQASPV